MELKKGKKVKVDDVVRSGEFEGVLIKVIGGDNNWNGIQDKGEDWYLASFKTLEPSFTTGASSTARTSRLRAGSSGSSTVPRFTSTPSAST